MAPPRRVAGQDGKARPVQVPLTEQEYAELERLCARLGKSKAEVFRMGLRAILGRAKRREA